MEVQRLRGATDALDSTDLWLGALDRQALPGPAGRPGGAPPGLPAGAIGPGLDHRLLCSLSGQQARSMARRAASARASGESDRGKEPTAAHGRDAQQVQRGRLQRPGQRSRRRAVHHAGHAFLVRSGTVRGYPYDPVAYEAEPKHDRSPQGSEIWWCRAVQAARILAQRRGRSGRQIHGALQPADLHGVEAAAAAPSTNYLVYGSLGGRRHTNLRRPD